MLINGLLEVLVVQDHHALLLGDLPKGGGQEEEGEEEGGDHPRRVRWQLGTGCRPPIHG